MFFDGFFSESGTGKPPILIKGFVGSATSLEDLSIFFVHFVFHSPDVGILQEFNAGMPGIVQILRFIIRMCLCEPEDFYKTSSTTEYLNKMIFPRGYFYLTNVFLSGT